VTKFGRLQGVVKVGNDWRCDGSSPGRGRCSGDRYLVGLDAVALDSGSSGLFRDLFSFGIVR